MTDVVATGPLSLPYVAAANLIAATAAFQSLCGAIDAAEAAAYVSYPSFDIQADPTLPRAVVSAYPGITTFEMDRLGAQSGSLILTVYDQIPEAYRDDEENDGRDWNNKMGAILSEMLQKSRTKNPTTGEHYWHLERVRELRPPGWMPLDETGLEHCRVASYLMKWL